MNFFAEMKSLASDLSKSQHLKSKLVVSVFSEDAFMPSEVRQLRRDVKHDPLAQQLIHHNFRCT